MSFGLREDEFWAAGIIEIGFSDLNAIRKHREMMTDRQKISLFRPVFADVNDELDQAKFNLAHSMSRPISSKKSSVYIILLILPYLE